MNGYDTRHVAVMTPEVLRALQPHSGGSYIDGTLGGGTHTEELLKSSSPDGRVLSVDVDRTALNMARERLAAYGDRWIPIESNFRSLAEKAEAAGFVPCDGIVLDLGISSDQLADTPRGLSFLQDGPLDMRLGPAANEDGLTAADIVNTWSASEIETLIREYGEERYARKIAEGIVRARKAARLIGTLDLVAVIRSSIPASYERGRIHPATRTFQALRITVNDELGALKEAIAGAKKILAPGGRLAVISFHSLEDRIVKQTFRESGDLRIITKRPLVPATEEIELNPRARSAKLRVAEKIEVIGN